MRVLIIGLDMYDYTSSLVKAFANIGCETKSVIMNEVGWRKTTKGKIYIKLKSFANYIMRKDAIALSSSKNKSQESEKVLKVYQEFKPDLVVSFAGYILTPVVLEKMRDAKKVLWIYDSIYRLPEIYNSLKHYDYIYSYERSDISFIRSHCDKAAFLPLCVDQDIYYQVSGYQKDVDISFIGSMTAKRVKLLKLIYKRYPDLNMVFYGKYLKRYNLIGYIKRFLFSESKCFTNSNISVDESLKLYARSKLCLNLLQSQSKDGANMRLFELMASGAFQIVNRNKYIEEHFSQCLDTFETEEEMFKKIDFYIKNQESMKIPIEKGLKAVSQNETFMHRAKKILDDVR